MQKTEAAMILAGVTPEEQRQASAPTNLHVITGTIAGKSENGKTKVLLEGLVFTADDNQYIEVDTLGGLEEGDVATILLTGEPGRAMTPLVVGAPGSIDRIDVRIKSIEADYVKATVLDAEVARLGYLTADNAVIQELETGKAYIDDLTANNITVARIVANSAYIKELELDGITADEITAATGYIDDLTANNITTDKIEAASGYIDDLTAANITASDISADHATVGQLDATYATIGSLSAEQARVDNLLAGKASVADLTAANGRIDNLQSTKADISVLESDYITANAIDATYLHADMSNADVAWIQNGVIKDGSISNAMINDVSANKLTAGTINGSVINVTNLNADNITAGTINGQRIGEGSLSLDKLSEDVYTEQEVDNKLATMQAEIDGAIETWTGTAVPTLNNSPASNWTTAAVRDTHVGDVYFVVNSQSEQNGYNYRFTKSGSTYSWQLIKDSDVTNALQRLSTAEGKITTFDSDISTLKTDTGTLKTKTESLETRMSDAEDDILDKVDTTTFNEVSDTVDQHSQTITQMSQTLSNKADGSTVTSLTQRVSKNEQDISGINTTIGELSTTVESKADGSTVESVSNRLNTVSNTVDGHTQSITNINNTLETKADGSTVSTLTAKVNNVSNTVDGHTSQLSTITSTQTSIQGSAVKSTVLLWFTKANTTAPNKPTAHVTTNNASTANAWNLAVPTYNASYPYYYYCYEHQLLNDTYAWSAVTRDIATEESQSTSRSAKATADKNVRASQQLLYTKANSTAPAKPTSKVTSTATTGGAWTTRVPTYSDSYKHYFYCMQYVAADGTVTWSDVVYDQATTEAQSVARAASADLTEFHQEYATFKQTTQEFESTVGETYATKAALETTEGEVSGLTTRMSTAESNITQNASDILLRATKDEVEKTYSTKEDSQLDRADSDTSVTVEGAATASLKGLHVLGKSVQDGTPTPSVPVPIVSVGAMNLIDYQTYYDHSTTTLSGDWLSNIGTDTRTYSAPVVQTALNGTWQEAFSVSSTNVTSSGKYSRMFTVTKAFNRVRVKHNGSAHDVVFADQTLTGSAGDTYYFVITFGGTNPSVTGGMTVCDVALYRTGSYRTYIPYGALGICVRSKNLLDLSDGLQTNTQYGVTITKNDDGSYSLSGTATQKGDISIMRVRYSRGGFMSLQNGLTYTFKATTSTPSNSVRLMLIASNMATGANVKYFNSFGGSDSFNVSADNIVLTSLYFNVLSGTNTNGMRFYPQLEVGAEATDFKPYTESVTPIPMNGHELRSLPDGTRDELTVDVDGRVTLTQRVGEMALTPATAWTVNASPDSYAYCYTTAFDAQIRRNNTYGGWSNRFPVSDSWLDASKATQSIMQIGNPEGVSNALRLSIPKSLLSASDLAGLRTWIDSNQTTVIYPLATPQTIDLGTIDMPQVKDGDTVEVIAALTPSIDATWWASAGQAVADAYASLSSAIEARAESIVSTVSERYATSQEVQAISSQITQTAQGWTAQFNQLTGGADLSMTLAEAFEALGVTSRNLEEIRSFVRITTDDAGDPLLLMGSATSPIMLALSNDSLRFMHGSDPVAYIDVDGTTNEGMLHITRAVVVKELQFGSWKWFERDGVGNLALKWVGDE